jgi:hypothetical protein
MEITQKELFPFMLVMFPEVGPTCLVAIVVGYIGLKNACELLREVDKRQSSPSPRLEDLRIMMLGVYGKLPVLTCCVRGVHMRNVCIMCNSNHIVQNFILIFQSVVLILQ